MGLLSWLVIGLLVAAGSILLFPDRGGGGAPGARGARAGEALLIVSAALVGALVGGLLVALFRWGSLGAVRIESLILALVGAASAVAAYRAARDRP